MKNIIKYFFVIGGVFLGSYSAQAQEAGKKNIISPSILQTDSVTTQKNPIKEFEYVAHGKQDYNAVTSSIFSISGEELQKTRSSNLFVALQGRLPGLRIIQSDGEPANESFNTSIRGYDSPENNGVLYVVDGVQRNPDGLEINDIERVTVLRDGAATAMYGMKGASGVLLITTKRGISGNTKITVTVDHSLQSPTRLPEFVSAYDYVNMFNQRSENDILFIGSPDAGVFYSESDIERYRLADSTKFFPVRDMMGDFMKDYSALTRANVNFRGGGKMVQFFTSVGFTNQGSLFEHEPFDTYSYDAEAKSQRFNFRTNLDIKLNKQLDAWVNIGGYIENANGPEANGSYGYNALIAKLYQTPNNAVNNVTEDGEVMIKKDKLTFSPTRSFYGDLYRTGSRMATTTKLANTFGARQKLDNLIPGLAVSGQIAFDVHSRSTQIRKRDYEGYIVSTLYDQNGADSLGFEKDIDTKNTTLSDAHDKFFYYMYDVNAAIDYNKKFGKHTVSGLFLGERHMQQQQMSLANNYLKLSGRATYGYDNRYFVEGNFAHMGTEQFAKGKRFGFFPSAAVAWVMSNENFLKDVSMLNYLKLRASVAKVGNSVYNYGGTDQYLFLTSWNPNATENQMGNEDISWQETKKYNIGIETKLFDAVYLATDFFSHKTTGVIVSDIAIIPDGMMGLGGASLPPANLGSSNNKGFELILGYNKEINDDLNISFNGNLSYSIDEVLNMAEMAYDSSYAYPYRSQGYAVGTQWGWQTDGLFNSQAEIEEWADQTYFGNAAPIPGDIKYKDLNGDDVVDEKDKAPIGTGTMPKLFYGFQTQVTYKWFDLRIHVNGAAKRQIMLNGLGVQSNYDNFTEYNKDAWTAEKYAAGETINQPRLGKHSGNSYSSDYWLQDGSFIRLKNVELGFTLPAKLSKAINAQSIRFWVNGLNLMIWDKLPLDYYDAEAAHSSSTNYPMLKAYNFGVKVKF